MNATHVAVGATTMSAMAALTILLTGFHGLDAAHAAAAAWLICAAVGAAYAQAAWFVGWKWPTVPPLPGRPQ